MLGLVFSLNSKPTVDDDAEVETIDAHLAGFFFHLSQQQREFHAIDGSFDEMIFQAHMIVYL